MTTDSPNCVGMVEMRTSTMALRILMAKRPSCGRRFLGNIQAGHQFQTQGQRRGDSIGFHLHLQHAVDAERTRSERSWGSMWMSEARERMASSNTVCSSLTTGASSAPVAAPKRSPELDRNVAQIVGQFLGQAGDFFRAAVDAVDQRQQLAFGNDGQLDVAAQQANQFVISLQVGRIDEADAQAAIDFHPAPPRGKRRACASGNSAISSWRGLNCLRST